MKICEKWGRCYEENDSETWSGASAPFDNSFDYVFDLYDFRLLQPDNEISKFRNIKNCNVYFYWSGFFECYSTVS